MELHLLVHRKRFSTLLGDFMKKVFGAIIAVLVLAGVANANGVPIRTRSDYGQDGSLILSTSTQNTGGVTIASQEFCSDAQTDATLGTCQLAFAFQITSTLPSNGTSLTLTFPAISGGTLVSSGLLTNDDPIATGNLFFSPFSQNDVLNLPDSAILFSADGTTFEFPLPITLNGGGKGLSLFFNMSDNNSLENDGAYCYKIVDVEGGCTAIDTPAIPTLGVDLKTSTVTAPEPASFSLLVAGLLGLGVLGRKRKSS